VYFDDTCIVNIYAPSGTAKRSEREDFFNSGILGLLPLSPTKLILAGDFKCVLNNNDCTGQRTCSRALERLINDVRLKGAWDTETNPHVYTHYKPKGAARIDRIYLSEDLLCNKQGAETIAAVFTDHLAVLIRIKLATLIILRGRGRWFMNTSFLKDAPFRRKLREAWNEWTQHIKRYADIRHWWVHYVKQKIKLLFTREGAGRNSDRRRMEDFYYTVIYDVVREPGQHADKMLKLKSLTAKIVRLNHTYRQRVMLNTAEQDRVEGGPPFITPPYKKSEEATEPNDQQDT